MSVFLRELEVEKAIRRYLKNNGFDAESRTVPQGVDILARKNGKTYYVEVEGNKKPDGNPLTTSQKYTHLLRAIGQICLRISENPEGTFVIGLPQDEYYKFKIKELVTALRRLNVEVLFVSSASQVYLYRP